MNFNEFIAKHPGIESDAAAMSLHSYMQGAQDARQIDTNCMSSILNAITCEVIRAEDKWPQWPENTFNQICIVAEESGEAVRAVNEYHNDMTESNFKAIQTELIQTAAMCVRMIKNLER